MVLPTTILSLISKDVLIFDNNFCSSKFLGIKSFLAKTNKAGFLIFNSFKLSVFKKSVTKTTKSLVSSIFLKYLNNIRYLY